MGVARCVVLMLGDLPSSLIALILVVIVELTHERLSIEEGDALYGILIQMQYIFRW